MTPTDLRRRAEELIARVYPPTIKDSVEAQRITTLTALITDTLTTVQREDGEACKVMMEIEIAACVSDAKLEEREACARVVETWADDDKTIQPSFTKLATAIRSRT